MLATRSYGLLDTTVTVASDLVDILDWVDQFLLPGLERRDEASPDYCVNLRIEEARYHEIYATRPSDELPLAPCFALDQEVVHHPHWISDGRTILADRNYEALYVLSGPQVEIVARPGAPRIRMAAMRVVRELALAGTLADERRLQLHAASLQLNNCAVLLAGPKGSGKSTLLSHIAAATGSSILANDRALLSFHHHGIEVCGIPTIVTIRPGTRDLMPEVFADAYAEALLEPSASLKVSTSQLAKILGVTLSAQANLAAIVFPDHHTDPMALTIDPVPIAEVRARLLQVRFGLHSGKREPTVFECLIGRHRSGSADERLIEEITKNIPCFSVKVGANALRDRATAERIVAAVVPSSVDASRPLPCHR